MSRGVKRQRHNSFVHYYKHILGRLSGTTVLALSWGDHEFGGAAAICGWESKAAQLASFSLGGWDDSLAPPSHGSQPAWTSVTRPNRAGSQRSPPNMLSCPVTLH